MRIVNAGIILCYLLIFVLQVELVVRIVNAAWYNIIILVDIYYPGGASSEDC